MRQKIMTEFALEDLVFEGEDYLNMPSDEPVNIQLENIADSETFLQEIAHEVALSFTFENTFGLNRLVETISLLKDVNCSALSITMPGNLSFRAQEWITIVQVVGESGMHTLEISNNDLDKSF